jgi:hypothetical protein
MYFDRFDIVEAHYAFCCDYHDGQWGELYRKACRIIKYFKASPLWKGFDSLSENGKEIYNALVEKHKY